MVGVKAVPVTLHFALQPASSGGTGGQVLFPLVKMKRMHFCHFLRPVTAPAGSQVFQI